MAAAPRFNFLTLKEAQLLFLLGFEIPHHPAIEVPQVLLIVFFG
jgi:hypothetical protein